MWSGVLSAQLHESLIKDSGRWEKHVTSAVKDRYLDRRMFRTLVDVLLQCVQTIRWGEPRIGHWDTACCRLPATGLFLSFGRDRVQYGRPGGRTINPQRGDNAQQIIAEDGILADG